MAEGLSLSELARQMGRAKSGLHKLAARGLIPKRADGKFDLETVRSAIAANTDPSRQSEAFTPVHGPENGERSAQNGGPSPEVAAQASQDALLATTRVREILKAEGIMVAADEPLTFNHARTAETIVKVWQRDQLYAAAKGTLIVASEAERRWTDETVKFRARLLAIPGDCALELPHLSKHELSVIDRAVRDAMTDGSDDDAP